MSLLTEIRALQRLDTVHALRVRRARRSLERACRALDAARAAETRRKAALEQVEKDLEGLEAWRRRHAGGEAVRLFSVCESRKQSLFRRRRDAEAALKEARLAVSDAEFEKSEAAAALGKAETLKNAVHRQAVKARRKQQNRSDERAAEESCAAAAHG